MAIQPSSSPNPFAQLPGFDLISGIMDLMSTLVTAVQDAVQTVEKSSPLDQVNAVLKFLDVGGKILQGDLPINFGAIETVPFHELYTSMLKNGLGVDTDLFEGQAKKVTDTIGKMLGFAFAIDAGSAALVTVGKLLLGDRWPEGLGEAFREIPSEMGLSWALGLQIDKAFEAATGNAIEEAILGQLMPRAPEWPMVRAMLKQHLIDPKTLDERMKASGFTAEWRDKLVKLADQRLAVGDLSNAFQHSILTADQVENYLHQLGFSGASTVTGMPSDVEILRTLYVDKAETEASRVYVSTARGLFRSELIDEKTYRTILENLNYPAKQIQDDVAAVLLEQGTGRIAHTTTAIKSALLHATIDQPTAILQLQQLGYSAAAATETTNSWLAPRIHPTHGLSQSLILSYLISGFLSPAQAKAKLTATGLDSTDADFLIAHPTAKSGVRVRPLTPAFVTQAYVDGVVDETQLSGLYTTAGVGAAQLNQQIAIAKYKLTHKRGGTNGTRLLSEGQIVDAWVFGLLDQPTAVGALVAQGYGTPDAELLLEIKNKGPITSPAPALFASVADAIAYLESLGYHILPPPDPHLNAALGMVGSAGYTIEPPQ